MHTDDDDGYRVYKILVLWIKISGIFITSIRRIKMCGKESNAPVIMELENFYIGTCAVSSIY